MHKSFTTRTVTAIVCGVIATAGFAASHGGGETRAWRRAMR
jgi:hypothetical protein